MKERKWEGFVKPPNQLNLELNKGFKNFLDYESFKILDIKNFKLIWMTKYKNTQKTNNKVIK